MKNQSKSLSKKERKQSKKPEQSQKKGKTYFFRTLFFCCKFFLGIIAIVGFLILMYPKISVSTAPSPKPNDIFATPILISNDSNYDIYEVKVLLGEQKYFARKSNGTLLPVTITNLKQGLTDNSVSKLGKGDKYTVYCPYPIILKPPDSIEFCDITIVVQFELPIVPIKQERLFRFTTLRGQDGNLHFYQQPLNKKIEFSQSGLIPK